MLSFLSWNVSGQVKNYAAGGHSIKTIAEYCRLDVSDSSTKYPVAVADDKARAAWLPILAAIVPAAFGLGEKLVSNSIKGNLKRYSAEYSARQICPKSEFLPTLTLQRQVYLPGKTDPEKAMSIELIPQLDQGSSPYFWFEIGTVHLHYAKAKANERRPLLNLLVEIELTFLTSSGEKVKQKSAAIALPPLSAGQTVSLKNDKLYSDKFTLNNTLSEINVRVLETNTAKIRLENLKETVDTLGPDVKTLTQTLISEILKAQIAELAEQKKEMEEQPKKTNK